MAKQLLLNITKEEHALIRELAYNQDTSMKEILIRPIKKMLDGPKTETTVGEFLDNSKVDKTIKAKIPAEAVEVFKSYSKKKLVKKFKKFASAYDVNDTFTMESVFFTKRGEEELVEYKEVRSEVYDTEFKMKGPYVDYVKATEMSRTYGYNEEETNIILLADFLYFLQNG